FDFDMARVAEPARYDADAAFAAAGLRVFQVARKNGRGQEGQQCCDQFLGHKTICVHRNNAIVLPVSLWVTVASQTWVLRPRCAGRATQAIVPVFAVPRKLLFSSIVVKFVAPSGRCATQP